MNNPSDDNPSKKNPPDSPVDINGARGQSVIMRNMLVVVLAFTSGFIDALSFLGLGVFASVQTGNTVLLGLAIGSGKIFQALVSLARYYRLHRRCRSRCQNCGSDSGSTKNMAYSYNEGLDRRGSSSLTFSNCRIFCWWQTQRSYLIYPHCAGDGSDGYTGCLQFVL